MKPLSTFTSLLLILILATGPAFANSGEILNMDPSQLNLGAMPNKQASTDELCQEFEASVEASASHNGKSLNDACAQARWTDDNQLQVKCSLRETGKNSQVLQYCKAKKDSKKAIKKLKTAAMIDAGAAALCLAEAFSPPNTLPPNTCGYAAIAAGAWETLRVAQQLFGGKGSHKIDETGNIEEKKPGLMGQLTTVAPLALGVIWGKKYFTQKCDETSSKFDAEGVESRKVALESDYKRSCQILVDSPPANVSYGHKAAPKAPVKPGEMELLETRIGTPTLAQQAAARESRLKECIHAQSGKGAQFKRMDQQALDDCNAANKKALAKRIGMLFAGLALQRAMNIAAAKKTGDTADETLRGLFSTSGNSAAGGLGGPNALVYTKPSQNGAATANYASITAHDLDEDSVEGNFLKNSPLGNQSADLVNRLGLNNPDKVDDALAANGGMGGLIGSMGAALGGQKSGILASLSEAKPYIANVDTSGTAYGSSGGSGRSGGGSADSGLNLNLGAILGESGEGTAAAGVSEDAFRAPARAGSIFHEDSPLNIFQIVSGKLEQAQKDSRVPVPHR